MAYIIIINNSIRFLIELFSFVILTVLSFAKFKFPVKLIVGLLIPVSLAILWGIFMAPNSAQRAPGIFRVMIEFVVFLTVFLVLKLSKLDKTTYIYLTIALINALFDHILEHVI